MRFRGTIVRETFPIMLEIVQIGCRFDSRHSFGNHKGSNKQALSATTQTLKNECVFILTPDLFSITIRAASPTLEHGTTCFVKLQAARMFTDYTVQSRCSNQIAFVCDIQHVFQALSSGKESNVVMMRLLKRNEDSLLCFKTCSVDVDIVQSIPIRVISIEIATRICMEPDLPLPEIAMELPPSHLLRSLVDRLKGIDRRIILVANKNGTLRFKIHTEVLKLQTVFVNLKHRDELTSSVDTCIEVEDDRREVSVAVDARMLSKSMLIDDTSVETLLCCISEGPVVALHGVLIDGFGSLTCYVPGKGSEEDT
uniref:Checkpoint protein n=1 Tax=Albugo laibachii Nc14 TaxID=890382 RepID=F0WPG2_9STRA|nr:conserved hypothetical protein [Albugo laibachii Nc14]|eukprot:CCA23210.1 conserved hypothetical protein [Albugo laibachii Nc14]